MARRQFKWKFPFLLTILFVNVLTKSILIERNVPLVISTDTVFRGLVLPEVIEESNETTILPIKEAPNSEESHELVIEDVHVRNSSINNLTRNIRPGQNVRYYNVEISIDGDRFTGSALIDVELSSNHNSDITFHCEDLKVTTLKMGIVGINNAVDANFRQEDGHLRIRTTGDGTTTYVLSIEYTGNVRNDGRGIFRGDFNGHSYIGMNLFPTYARRVFPCMDEIKSATVNFKFSNVGYSDIISNSMLVENSVTDFLPMELPLHLWGLVAHDFTNISVPATNVHLYGSPGINNQDAQASVAIKYIFTIFNEWMKKDYFTIINNQNTRFNIFAVPDLAKDWYSLSSMCIWEPYIYMENQHSIMQRLTSFIKLSEGISKQWFGYVIYPTNWRFDWIVSGFGNYVAYEILTQFQTPLNENDTSLIDMNAIFVSEVIQESLLQDSYDGALALEPTNDLVDENAIREYVNGLMKIKAPALLRTVQLIINSPDTDHLQNAARMLFNRWPLQGITSQSFYDVVAGTRPEMPPNMNRHFSEFMKPYIRTAGYPVIHVRLINGGVWVTREHFTFGKRGISDHRIPITYTTSMNPDFSTNNIYPLEMIESPKILNMELDEERRDWVIFNIQGQYYYRVDYEIELWERIIEALEDPERREVIHPLNRATLVDDALNHARAGRLNYDIAFRIVLTMEHETHYAPWRAFIRNMDFIRKHINALRIEDNETYEEDVYLKFVSRTIKAVESELGFMPDPLYIEPAMDSLTRGVVMDHACRSNYQPCIAAAVDWFWNPDNSDVVNPNIPHDIRPAVFCTMVREGGNQAISALNDRLEIEQIHFERLVILKSFGCSNNDSFIATLLQQTVADGNQYAIDERPLIFKSVAEGGYLNSILAMNFMANNADRIRSMYGGSEALEEMIRILADNMANSGSVTDYSRFLTSVLNDLDDSLEMASTLEKQLKVNNDWDNNNLDYIYEWIGENDASTVFVSLGLLSISVFISFLNV